MAGVYYLHNLNILRLHSLGLTGTIPSEIGQLTELKYLDLKGNQLIGGIPECICTMTGIWSIAIRHNELTGQLLDCFVDIENVGYFGVNNNLSGYIPESICNTLPWELTGSLSDNSFCPPYIECIEEYVGEQNTSECGD